MWKSLFEACLGYIPQSTFDLEFQLNAIDGAEGMTQQRALKFVDRQKIYTATAKKLHAAYKIRND